MTLIGGGMEMSQDDISYGVQIKEPVQDEKTRGEEMPAETMLQKLTAEIAVLQKDIAQIKQRLAGDESPSVFFNDSAEKEGMALNLDELQSILDTVEIQEQADGDDLAVFPKDLYVVDFGQEENPPAETAQETVPDEKSPEQDVFEKSAAEETIVESQVFEVPAEITEEKIPEEEPVRQETAEVAGRPDVSPSLLQDIKTLLAYLDTLLESLPESKVAEFANSAYFETYKRIFKELGLA
ncbi:MAG: hypothetical protein LBS97_00405 [Treponema sp.]|nr:hypothetical protein [Treponema sp.]